MFNFLGMFWKIFGHVLEIFGRVLDMFWKIFRLILEIFGLILDLV